MEIKNLKKYGTKLTKKNSVLSKLGKPLKITLASIALLMALTACGDNEIVVEQTAIEVNDPNADIQPTEIPIVEEEEIVEVEEVEEVKTIEVYSDEKASELYDEHYNDLIDKYGNILSAEEIGMFLCYFNSTSISENIIMEKTGLTFDDMLEPTNIIVTVHKTNELNIQKQIDNVIYDENNEYIDFSNFIFDENLSNLFKHLNELYITQFETDDTIRKNAFLELVYFFNDGEFSDTSFDNLYCTINDEYLNNPSGEVLKDFISCDMLYSNLYVEYFGLTNQNLDEFKIGISKNVFESYTVIMSYYYDYDKSMELYGELNLLR